MEIVPLGPGFAAELRGVTLAEIAADEAAYKETRAAFEQHSVIVFRGQEVTDEAQLAFSRRFGPLEVTKVGSLGAGTNLVILSTIDENGKVVPADHRLALRNKANQLWHTDSTFKRVPALASVLSARIIPGARRRDGIRLDAPRLGAARGGAAPAAREFLRLARLRPFARQDRARPRERRGARGAAAAMLAHGVEEPGQRPQRALLASHAYAIEGMEQAAAQKLLAELMDAATAPGRSYVHSWRKRRRRHVGQPRDHASRPTMARARGAAHGAHDDLRDRGGRARDRPPAVTAGGRMSARPCKTEETSVPHTNRRPGETR